MLKLAPDTLDWALKHIETFGDTDIFPVPFEYQAIRHCWDSDIKPYILSQDITNWQARPYRRCLTPKHRFGFRIATQFDPLDTIIFTALVAEIGNDLESTRLPASANVAFSYRFAPLATGEMYKSSIGFSEFREQSIALLKNTTSGYIVMADIADFYPRIYSHPLENALDECSSQKEHINAIKRFLNKWNFTTSYGIPVGSSATRLLAELVLDDIDRGLISEGVIHCRFVDDFRIFCSTEREAHQQLALLAHLLYENLSLTLQQHKTQIISATAFEKDFVDSQEKKEITRLTTNFKEILAKAGIANTYDDIDIKTLDTKTKKQLAGLNLIDLLKEQIKDCNNLDIPVVRFALRRLGQFDDMKGLNLVLSHIDKLYPVFVEVVQYCQNLRSLNPENKHKVGKILLGLLDSSLVGHLEFHRLWVLETFTKSIEWDNEEAFAALFNKYTDDFSRREIILALGRSKNISWFKSRKRDIQSFGPWLKRAFLAAASCLPGDEFTHWIKSISISLDPLEKAIGKWVKDNPY